MKEQKGLFSRHSNSEVLGRNTHAQSQDLTSVSLQLKLKNHTTNSFIN